MYIDLQVNDVYFDWQGSVYRHSSVYEYIMSQPNVVARVNSMVQSMERPFMDLTGTHDMPGAGTCIALKTTTTTTTYCTCCEFLTRECESNERVIAFGQILSLGRCWMGCKL